MAEVQSCPPKQKMSLDGFLENQGGSNTHHARKMEARKVAAETTKYINNDTADKDKAESNANKTMGASLLVNVCGDEAMDALLSAAKKDKLSSGSEYNKSQRSKPKRSSSSKMKRPNASEDQQLLSSQSAHSTATYSSPEGQPQPRSSGSKPKRRAPPSRSKSFNLDGAMSAEGAGPKPFTSAEDKPVRRKPPGRSQSTRAAGPNSNRQRISNTTPTAGRQPTSRSRSYDDNTPLKRIPRNPPRGVMVEKQPSERKLQNRQRRGKKPEKQSTTTAGSSSHDTNNKQQQQQQNEPRKSQEKTNAASGIGEGFSAQFSARTNTSTEEVAAFAGHRNNNDTDPTFLTSFPDSKPEQSEKQPPEDAPTIILRPTENDSDSSEGELEEEIAKDDGIIQFDPSAMDNVKMVRQGSQDQFPMCAVDIGLIDHDNGHGSSEAAATNSDHAGITAGPVSSLSFFAKPGRGFFQSKLGTSGSFRLTKRPAQRSPSLVDQEELTETVTAAMGAAVMSLTKAWSGQRVGHQELDDGGSDEES